MPPHKQPPVLSVAIRRTPIRVQARCAFFSCSSVIPTACSIRAPDNCAPQSDGSGEIGVVQIGIRKTGVAEICSAQVSLPQRGSFHVGVLQIGAAQASVIQIRASQIRVTEIRLPKIGAPHREALQLRMRKVGLFSRFARWSPARHGDRRGPAPAGPGASLGTPDAPSSDFLILAVAS